MNLFIYYINIIGLLAGLLQFIRGTKIEKPISLSLHVTGVQSHMTSKVVKVPLV